MLAIVLLAAGCGHAQKSTRGGAVERFTIHSAWVHRDLHEILVVPPAPRGPRWLLVLLHGATGSPDDFLSQQFFDGLQRLGPRAPYVLLLDDDGDSYWHDRRTGRWGKEVLLEAIPAGIDRVPTRRIALGGVSMGGYGALHLGVGGTFCAVGGHSPALWRSGADTAPGAFDDASDFARNDIVNHPPDYGRTPVWIDVGASDGFRPVAVQYAHEVHAQLHVWPGGHDGAYWRAHIAQYLRWYARYCSR